jgi:hypothetical protein
MNYSWKLVLPFYYNPKNVSVGIRSFLLLFCAPTHLLFYFVLMVHWFGLKSITKTKTLKTFPSQVYKTLVNDILPLQTKRRLNVDAHYTLCSV